jgi:hypothetical protein
VSEILCKAGDWLAVMTPSRPSLRNPGEGRAAFGEKRSPRAAEG